MSNFIENSPHFIWSFEDLPDLTGAPCDMRLGLDPEMWFVDDLVIQKIAKAVCRRCPIKKECLSSSYEEEAQTGYFAHGIRGGVTADKRQVVLDKMREADSDS